ncbi:MAG TPA: ferrochelatase [Candidatus Paceibacterota bacterium]|nr:ferrochelatase [Candidatus Paceibacterota bacterium]
MENSSGDRVIGVVVMTYGSATTVEHVAEYMAHIYHGAPPADVVKDFEERYRLMGPSPLIEITQQQAQLIEVELNHNAHPGDHYVVHTGMLHSEPFIERAVKECRDAGAERCIGVILSPQFSSFIMDGYRAAFERAARAYGIPEEGIIIADPWPTEPHFIRLLSDRVRASLQTLEDRYHKKIPVIFTTHSLPKRVVEKDPHYLDQLQSTIRAVLEHIGDPSLEWYAGYQSAGHTPEEWLKPDLTDILTDIKNKGAPAVLIVPIQFLADHLEILYDLDIAARKQCEDLDIAYHRIQLPNTDPLFIKSIADVVYNTNKHI